MTIDTQPSLHRQKLHNERKALAILDDGIIVFANHAFASRLGYDSPEDLEAMPLLDLVTGFDKHQLRDYLQKAQLTEKHEKNIPKANIRIQHHSGEEKKAELHAHKVHFENDDAVELQLLTEEDFTFKGRAARLPGNCISAVCVCC